MQQNDLRVFVINLNRAHDRLHRIARCLQTKGIPFERIEAVDGLNVSDPKKYVSPLSRLLLARALTQNEIACWLSHRKVWKKIISERIPLALILEDDAIPCISYEELMSVCLSGISLDLLRAHVILSEKGLKKRKRMVETGIYIANREVFLPASPIFSGAAYFITLRGAEILASRRKMIAPLDWFSLSGAFDGLRHGFVLPGMFEVNDSGVSQIGDRRHEGIARRYYKIMKRSVLGFLDRRHAAEQLRELYGSAAHHKAAPQGPGIHCKKAGQRTVTHNGSLRD